MSVSKRLLLLLTVFAVLVLLSSGIDWVKNFDWQNIKLPGLKAITRIQETERVKVVNEESEVISVVEKTSPAVVSVVEKAVVFDLFRGPTLSESSIGTGFAVKPDLVVTNKHVVSDTTAGYTIVTKDDQKLAVTQIFRDPVNDLALLRIENGNLLTLELGDSDSVKVGQTVIAIGNALGRFSNTVTKGVISGIGRGISAQAGPFGQAEALENVLQTDAALNPGNSGGPLLNILGQVIGVNVAMGQGTENIGFAIPVNRAKELIENFSANKKISRPFLGVEYILVSKSLAEEQGLVEGAFVRSIVGGSAAAEAGLKINDIITEIDGIKIDQKNTLAKLILKNKVGDKVTLTVWRNGKVLKLSVTLQEVSQQ